MAAVTRLGPGGGPRGLYGDFSGKAAAAVQLSGTIGIQWAPTGALDAKATLAGGTGWATAPTGALDQAATLAGSTGFTWTPSGNLTEEGAATGNRGGGGKAKGYKFVELYDRYAVSRTAQQQERQVAKQAAMQAKDATDRELARLLHKQMEKEARDKEIAELKVVMEAARQEDLRMYNEAVAGAYVRAMEAQTFSTIEAFERQMDMAREEEEFLLLAMAVLH